MSRPAFFHLDPTVHAVDECTEQECEEEHHAVHVRGFHSVERFECKHHVHVMHWHELTPLDHPSPSCEHGCTMTAEIIG